MSFIVPILIENFSTVLRCFLNRNTGIQTKLKESKKFGNNFELVSLIEKEDCTDQWQVFAEAIKHNVCVVSIKCDC